MGANFAFHVVEYSDLQSWINTHFLCLWQMDLDDANSLLLEQQWPHGCFFLSRVQRVCYFSQERGISFLNSFSLFNHAVGKFEIYSCSSFSIPSLFLLLFHWRQRIKSCKKFLFSCLFSYLPKGVFLLLLFLAITVTLLMSINIAISVILSTFYS